MKINTAEQYDNAKSTLQAAASAYYAGTGQSTMADDEYDALMADVTAYEADHNIDGVSTTVAAGAVTGNVEHDVPMLSLNNVFSVDEFEDWCRQLTGRIGHAADLVVEPKLDGMAMSIRYVDGTPVSMTTRGDGRHGEDVTAALAQITNLPHHSDFTGTVRGEVIFTAEQFTGANEIRTAEGDKPFANARNGIAGAVNGASKRNYDLPCSFFAYDVISPDRPDDHEAAMVFLDRMEFATARSLLSADDRDPVSVLAYIEFGQDMVLPVATDGLVIKADRATDRDEAGSGSKAPHWAIAYKFPPEEVTTTLNEVIWQVGRTGRITPRAVIEPVAVGGVTNTYATLNNPADIKRKDLMLGDVITVRRAGEVIPEVVRSIPARRDGSQTPIITPTDCPQCGGGIDTSQAVLRCLRGRDCAVVASLTYAASRDALDIDGLSTSIIQRMVDAGLVSDLGDLFSVSASALSDVPGEATYGDTDANRKAGRVGQSIPLGSKTAAKIEANIAAAKHAEFARVVTALGIRGTGRSMSRKIAAHFVTMDALASASVDDFLAVESVGQAKADLLSGELTELAPVIAKMRAAGVTMEATVTAPASSVLADQKVCVTGSMTGPLADLSRTGVQELIEAHGGKSTSSVSKTTTLLVAGDGAGSKLAKATDLGVEVVSPDEFATRLGL